MRAVVEKVKKCTLYSEGEKYSESPSGILVLFGVHETDTFEMIPHFAQKILKLRIFRDDNGKMNNDICKVNGQIMLVSNFTLYGRTKNTNRPDFTHAAKPDHAEQIYLALYKELNKYCPTVTGVFRTHMDIEMIADGPGTFLLEEYSNPDVVV